MRTTLVYQGPLAVASRVDLGPLTPEASTVDWWILRAARRHAVHITLRHPYGSGAYILRVLGTLWRTDGSPVPNLTDVALRIMLTTTQERAREIARHLARNAAEGNIPLWPESGDDTQAWTLAIGIAEAFTERFGSFETLLREAPR